jgi:hypothetical protein
VSEWISPDRQEYHVWFDSVAELHRELPAMQLRANRGDWNRRMSSYYDGDWYGHGIHIGSEAIEIIAKGAPDLLALMQPMIQALRKELSLDTAAAIQVETRRRKRHRSDYGDTLDMHRVWSGDLDRAWERPVREPRLTPTERYASVFLDLGVLSDVDAVDTLWRGAAGLCMVDTLTRMGVSVELWAGASGRSTYEYGPDYRWSGVRVKEYAQPLNEERLAAVAHAMFHRTFSFGMYLAAPFKATSGLGRPTHTGLVKPLRDRAEAGERVFRVGECLTRLQAVCEVQKVIDALKNPSKEAA